tara:strand:- start:272 stop:496 length:225 start_codon:yes stop_codon:yes gene_type:complete
MNQENIDSLTEKIKVGDLVEVLFQDSPTFGLVVAISKGPEHHKGNRKKRAMTFLTMSTSNGLRKYPIFWCKTIE